MPRTTRVAAFRNSPRRRRGGGRGVALIVVTAAIAAAGLWWFWHEPDRASAGGDLAAETTPVGLTLEEPTRTAQRAITDMTPPPRFSERAPADTIAASPERAVASTPARNEPVAPPPVDLRQSFTPAKQSGAQGSIPASTPAERPVPLQTSAPSQPQQQTTPAQPASYDPAPSEGSDITVARMVAQAEAALSANKPVEARIAFNRALHSPGATAADRQSLRARLAELNQKLVFSPVVTPGDPLVETYTIQSGDVLAKIVDLHDLSVDWRLVQRINGVDPRRIRVGQKIKLVRGPFHAVVHKRDYRLDLYSDRRDPDGNRLYIRSFSVGLGENDSTPLGKFRVKNGSKLIDPHWVNPRTGERFSNSDPMNPIGERWIGIEGAEQATMTLSGYGIHGTIEPQSIGRDASMGCVRMLAEDVELVYELLAERVSEVEIRP